MVQVCFPGVALEIRHTFAALEWDDRPVDPQEDPEARIRELERSLDEQARASEVVAGQPGGYVPPPGDCVAPPIPPPLTYGAPPTPIHATPLGATAGFRLWWIVLAAFVLAVVPVIVGVVI